MELKGGERGGVGDPVSLWGHELTALSSLNDNTNLAAVHLTGHRESTGGSFGR